jgi:hypothetical protein
MKYSYIFLSDTRNYRNEPLELGMLNLIKI